jgi:hypothetical protein
MKTLVGLFARMCTVMDSQGALLNEAFATASHRTSVRPFVGVNPVVSLQVGFSVETLQLIVSITQWQKNLGFTLSQSLQ